MCYLIITENKKTNEVKQTMTKYQIEKEKSRQEAIEWQNNFDSCSFGELMHAEIYFEKMARRYGLIKEFKENGII